MRTIAGTARSMGLEVGRLDPILGAARDERTMTQALARSTQQRPPRSTAPSATPSRRPASSSRDQGRAKFDETVDIAVRLGVNPKHADQMVRGAVVLPHGTGKSHARRSSSPRATRPRRRSDAGADFVGAEDLVKKIQKENWLDFDSMVATPDMMGLVGRLGRVLGPRGLMPNPKVGTVTDGRHQGGPRAQGRPRRVPRREGRHRPRPHRQGVVRRRQARARTPARCSRRCCKLKPPSAKGTYMKSVDDLDHHGPGHQDRPRVAAGRRVRDASRRCRAAERERAVNRTEKSRRTSPRSRTKLGQGARA